MDSLSDNLPLNNVHWFLSLRYEVNHFIVASEHLYIWSFLSNIKKVVDSQLESYITDNKLYDPLQSAYTEFHSTETALVKVTNDILCSVDNKKLVILVLMELSAAFDTVTHKFLLHTLEHEFGIIGSALA